MRITSQLSIMFADINDGARLYQILGDTQARDVLSRGLDLLHRVTKNYGGKMIKTVGEGIMSVFPTSRQAAQAAVAMQESVSSNNTSIGYAVTIRVGFHHGEVIEEDNDVFGDAVNLAARMLAQAKAEQIITTGETMESLPENLRSQGRWLITTTVKGKQKPVEIFELTWGKPEDLTYSPSLQNQHVAAHAAPVAVVVAVPVLHVRYLDKTIIVDEANPSLNMGRDATNHFPIQETMASRMHVKIDMRRGKYILIDQSTNGTYVITEQGRKFFVHRDELVLDGDGMIGLGKEVLADDPATVFYELR